MRNLPDSLPSRRYKTAGRLVFASGKGRSSKGRRARRISRTFARTLCALITSSGAIASSAFADGSGTTFNYTGTIQTFTVPQNGYYLISATGAIGAGGEGSGGGAGARAAGVVHLTGGTVLNVVVGGAGSSAAANDPGGGAGGGGSSVYIDTSRPLIVGGGGGGGGKAGGGRAAA